MLAPTDGGVVDKQVNACRHRMLLAAVQRFRAQTYLADGAITPDQLTSDQRHDMAVDHKSWHLITLTSNDRVLACMRLTQHTGSVSYDNLQLSCEAAQDSSFTSNLRAAVDQDLSNIHIRRRSVVELGGWAVAEEVRRSMEAMRMLIASFAWSRLMGGCIGFGVATVRNGSAAILRRIGGESLYLNGEAIPPYFDHKYGCEMHPLRFDSFKTSSKYEHWISTFERQLTCIPVICAPSATYLLSSPAADRIC